MLAKRNKSVKNTLRKVKNSHFRLEVSSDASIFDEFYYKMHLPYIQNRHGESSLEESYERMKARFSKNSDMLFLIKGSQRIAGIMICYQNGEALAYRLGVRNGDFRWVEKGAISALYVNTMSHCRAKGFKKLSLGGSRPFFSDGVLTYKQRNWNMKIDDYSKHFYFLIKPFKANPFAKEFLLNNSFISLNKGEMVVNTFYKNSRKENNRAKAMKTKDTKSGISRVKRHTIGKMHPAPN